MVIRGDFYFMVISEKQLKLKFWGQAMKKTIDDY